MATVVTTRAQIDRALASQLAERAVEQDRLMRCLVAIDRRDRNIDELLKQRLDCPA